MTLQAIRCHHCRRLVSATRHGRGGARVDYYRTVTGRPREETFEDPAGGDRPVRVLRVDSLCELITCRDCWARGSVQAALAEARRTGSLPRA